MSKNKIIAGVVGLIAIISVVHTQAIIALTNKVNTNNQQSSVRYSNPTPLKKSTNLKSEKHSSIESYFDEKYLNMSDLKLGQFENEIKSLLNDNSLSEEENIGFIRRFICKYLMGGVYLDYPAGNWGEHSFNSVSVCVKIEEIRFLEEGLAEQPNNNIISNEFLNYRSDEKTLDLTDKNLELLKRLNSLIQSEEINENVAGPGFRRFICKLFGGTWITFSSDTRDAEYDYGLPALHMTGDSCVWGYPL